MEEEKKDKDFGEDVAFAEEYTASSSSDADSKIALEQLQSDYEELNDRFLRLAADFDNFKKRVAKDTEARISFVLEQFAIDILDVVDNLERAARSDDSSLREGLEQIHKLLTTILERRGIVPVECLDTKFDPSSQEAIAHVPSDLEEGMVIDEISRGYQMKGKIIRCAKVAVSKGKEMEV